MSSFKGTGSCFSLLRFGSQGVSGSHTVSYFENRQRSQDSPNMIVFWLESLGTPLRILVTKFVLRIVNLSRFSHL